MPTKAELQAEVARLREALDQFINIDHARLVSFKDGAWEFKSPIFPVFVHTLGQMLAEVNAPNHIELRAGHPEIGPIVLTIQKEWGKTPTDLRIEAEKERDQARYEAEQNRLKATLADQMRDAAILWKQRACDLGWVDPEPPPLPADDDGED